MKNRTMWFIVAILMGVSCIGVVVQRYTATSQCASARCSMRTDGHEQAAHCCLAAPSAAIIDWKNTEEVDELVPVLVIGSGSAGLVAAEYCARNGYQVLLVEGDEPGGALTKTSYIDNWPAKEKILGPTLMAELTSSAQGRGVYFMSDTVTAVDFKHWPYRIETNQGAFHALSVIITTGATPRRLGVDGEEQYWGKGVTTCALCDAPFYVNKEVVVVGGGDAAVEEAMQLTSFARSITILVRDKVMRASAAMQERLKGYPSITVRYQTQIAQILGNGSEVTGVMLKMVDGSTQQAKVDGVFLAIGQLPNTTLFKEQLALHNNGYIQLYGRSQATSCAGVFAAGDASDGTYRQAGTAAGDAIKASIDLMRWLHDIGYTAERKAQLELKMISDAHPIGSTPASPETGLHNIESNEELSNILTQNGILLIDCYTNYCPSCKRLLPYLQTLAARFGDRLLWYKANIELITDLRKKPYLVNTAPTILAFNNGTLVGRYAQAVDEQKVQAFVERLLE
ncbi:MAG: FAD-dependent oxidoreductase [Candidatus Babeliales bacterium]